MLPVLAGPQVSWLLSQQCALQSRRDELTTQQGWRSNLSWEGSLSRAHSDSEMGPGLHSFKKNGWFEWM